VSEKRKQQKAFDVLNDILETLHFRGTVFFRSDLSAPWGMSLPKNGTPRFHVMLSGSCFVGNQNSDLVKLGPQEIVMLPRGTAHWIADQPGRDLVPSEAASLACNLNNPLFQKGETTNTLFCGMAQFDHMLRHPFFDALPEVIRFPSMDECSAIWKTVTLIDQENQSSNSSKTAIIDRLAEVLFIQLLTHYISHDEDAVGFIAAMKDFRVHRALTLIHSDPASKWTLASLGEKAGMSKATLVRRFQEIMGISPMAYITDWRIMKAYSLVKYSGLPMELIADVTGFASARSLNKTFNRHYGFTPAALRRNDDSEN
jgi:AraC-like DNA-binding protein